MRPFRIAYNSKFRCDDDVLAVQAERAPNQLFVGVRPVHVRRVEECDAEIQRAMDCGGRFLVVTVAVKVRHAHAAKANRRDNRAAASKFSLFHCLLGFDCQVDRGCEIRR